MRRGLAGALAAIAVASGLGLGGCGDGPAARLAWQKAPLLVRPQGLPHDRILTGVAVNRGERKLTLDVDKVRLLDGAGKRVPGSVRFLASFVHGLHSPMTTSERRQGPAERLRLGLAAIVAPDGRLPVTIAWRLAAGAPPPVRIDLGGVTLPVPATPTPRPATAAG